MMQIESFRARVFMRELIESPEPGAMLCALAKGAGDEKTSGFERYASKVLRDAGALTLPPASAAQLRLRSVLEGQSVRVALLHDPMGPHGMRTRVLEDALNRLLGIAGALSSAAGFPTQAESDPAIAKRRALYEDRGMDYPLWSDTRRGSNVVLPPLGAGERADDAYFNEIDWRIIDAAANNAHAYFQAAILVNANQTIFGVKATHGSEWDVRTRLASILEGLITPLHLAYRFDCDASRGHAAITFTVPSTSSFPALARTGPRKTPEAHANQLEAARSCYALRLSALLGAACFGSGRVIERATVIGRDDGGRVLSTCYFERTAFVHETLPVIDAGLLSAPLLRFDPVAVAQTIKGADITFAHAEGAPSLQAMFAYTRPDPKTDTRILPADLQRLFHARRVCDVDTSGYLGGSAHIIDEARADSDSSLAAAILQLESVVGELEAELAPPEGASDARPLYCEHAMARVAIALIDDDLGVSGEAEAFLNPETHLEAPSCPDVLYYRAPDALFHAHVGLADLYRKMGDAMGAEAQADRCIALGPTTPVGYALKADALASRGRMREAVNILFDGLRSALADADQSLLLYALAKLFWRMGRRREASALHIFTSTYSGPHAAKSADFVTEIADGADIRTFVRDNKREAADIVSGLNMPLVPERIRLALIARAAFGLADAGALRVAAPYAALLARHFPANRAIATACDSIVYGVGTPKTPES